MLNINQKFQFQKLVYLKIDGFSRQKGEDKTFSGESWVDVWKRKIRVKKSWTKQKNSST